MITFGVITFLMAVGSIQSHRINLRYNLWKAGLIAYQPDLTLRLFQHDHAFQKAMRGKSLAEVEKLFPNLVEPQDGKGFQREYDFYTEGKTFRWIADSRWGILFENETVKEVVLLKG